MSYAEAISWKTYIAQRGGLNLASRIEFGFAMLAALVVNRTGGKASVRDFMPHLSEDDGEATLQDVMKILTGAKL